MSTGIPLFEQPMDGASPSRRILLFSYHFPPGQAAGARRWERLAHFASERGWGLDVITLSPRYLDRADATRLERLPAGTRVYVAPDEEVAIRRLERRLLERRTAPERKGRGPGEHVPPAETTSRPSSFRRDEIRFEPLTPRSWLRGYEALVEYWQGLSWARRAEAQALEICGAAHRLVVSCGPPHLVHEAGRRLSRRLDVPLVMDLRDPWSFAERAMEGTASPLWFRLASFFERRAVARAALIVMNTDPACTAMKNAYPEHARRVVAVANGWDEDELPHAPASDRFLAAYAGSIYIDRSPQPLLCAARRLIDELRISPGDFGIELMGDLGKVDGVSVPQMVANLELQPFVRLHSPGNAGEAAAFLARAALLVNLPQDTELAIASKIFEYMRYPAWLLALEPPGTATAQLLSCTEADVVDPRDICGIHAVLRRRYEQFKSDGRPAPLARPEFSRRAQGEKLFDEIDSLTK